MGRPAIYGRQLVLDKNNKFVGINLGYNYYCEHEGDTTQLAYFMNRHTALINQRTFKDKSRLRKSNKQLKRWENTPYNGNVFSVLYSITPYIRKEIIVDNTSIKDKYNTFLLENTEYILTYIGSVSNDDWHRRFGNRRKFTEEELLYMPDYQGYTGNVGAMLGNINGNIRYGDNSFVGSWMVTGSDILIIEKKSQSKAIDGILNALTKGNLGIASNEQRLFRDRGLQLIDLEVAYLTGRR